MEAETLLTAEQAVEWGFADEIEEPTRMAASANVSGSLAAARKGAELEASNIVLRARLEALTAKRTNLERQLAERQQSARLTLESMAPAAVIAAAAEAGSPEWLAARCFREKYPEAIVQRHLADFAGIQAAAQRAGLGDVAALLQPHFGDRPAMISALLVEALSMADDRSEIANRAPVDDRPPADLSGAYQKRRPG